jgi:hypothetical protein
MAKSSSRYALALGASLRAAEASFSMSSSLITRPCVTLLAPARGIATDPRGI